MCAWIVGFLTDYQVWATILAAAAGFGGIAATLIVQHRNDLRLQSIAEQRERQRIRAAIRTELVGVKEYASEGAKHLGAEDFMLPKRAPFAVIRALIGRIDLLSASQVVAVVQCYVWLDEIPQRLSLIAKPTAQPVEHYVLVQAQYLHVLRFLFEELERLAEAAIKSLSDDDQ